MPPNHLPLTSRPLDLLYFLFFIIHLVAALSIDAHTFYPAKYVPEQVAQFLTVYLQSTADPLIAGAFGLNGPPGLWVWFKSFKILEVTFQLPVSLIGLRGLWRDSRGLYPLFLIYSASSATMALPCISTILNTPLFPSSSSSSSSSSSPVPPALLSPFSSLPRELRTPDSGIALGETGPLAITSEQRTLLLAGYLAFLLVPLLMCFDMAVRVAGLISAGLRAEKREREIKG